MPMMIKQGRVSWVAFALVLVSAAGCQGWSEGSREPWQLLVADHEGATAQQSFLEVLRANGVEEAFQSATSHWSGGERQWRVETVRVIPGLDRLVYVRVSPNSKGRKTAVREGKKEDPLPEHLWFFFDHAGNLLVWSDSYAGTWLAMDVTGDGVKDLLVSSSSRESLKAPQEGDGRAYYTLYCTSTSPPTPILFGASAVEGVSYGFTVIHLRNVRSPLVMTYELGFPLDAGHGQERGRKCDALMPKLPYTAEDGMNNGDGWYGSVIRSFDGGRPSVLLAVPSRLTLCTSPGGQVVLRPEYADEGYEVTYSPAKRGFEIRWLEDGRKERLRFFSKSLPQ